MNDWGFFITSDAMASTNDEEKAEKNCNCTARHGISHAVVP